MRSYCLSWDMHARYVTSVMSDSLWSHGPESTRLLCPWEISRQKYWSRLPCPPPGELPDPVNEPVSCISCIGRQVLYHKHHLGINQKLVSHVAIPLICSCIQSFVHSLTHSLWAFTEHVCLSRHWGFYREKDRQSSCPHRAYPLLGVGGLGTGKVGWEGKQTSFPWLVP